MSIVSKSATAAALVAAIGAAAVPATASAATAATTTTQTHTYHISVNPGVLAAGQDSVTANVKVANPVKSVRDFWSRSTIQQVVRQGVNSGYQMPYNTEGFRCVPVMDGSMNASTANFTCKLPAPTITVTLTFAAPYMQSAGS